MTRTWTTHCLRAARIFAVALLVPGCGGSGGGGGPVGGATPTIILTPLTMSKLISSSDAQLTFASDATQISSASSGDILVFAGDPALFRKVVSVTATGPTLVVQTSDATIAEAVGKGAVAHAEALTNEGIQTVEGGAVSLKPDPALLRKVSGTATLDFPVSPTVIYDEAGVSVTLSGSASLNVAYELDASFDAGHLSYFLFRQNATGTFSVSLDITGTLTKKVEKLLYSYKFSPKVLWIGTFPVWIRPVFELYGGAQVSVNSAFTIQVAGTVSVISQIEYLNGIWTPSQSTSPSFSYTTGAYTSLDAKAYLKPLLKLTFYEVAGAYVGLREGLHLLADSSGFWRLNGYLELLVGVQLKILDWIDESKEWVLYKKEIPLIASSLAPNDLMTGADAPSDFASAITPAVMQGYGSLDSSDTSDFFRWALNSGDTLAITATAPSFGTIAIQLLSPQGSVLKNFALNTSEDVSFSHTALVPGDYRIAVFLTGGDGSYMLRLAHTLGLGGSQDDLGTGQDAGNAFSARTRLTLSGGVLSGQGNLVVSTDNDDWYEVFVSAGDVLSLTMQPASNLDFDLLLYDASGSILRTSTLDGPEVESISATAGQSAYYVIRVRREWGSGTYSLAISVATPSAPGQDDLSTGADAGNTFATATPITPRTGSGILVADSDRDDYFSLALSSNDVVNLSLTPSAGADLDLFLFKPDGSLFNSSTQGGATAETIVQSVSAPGNWRIQVHSTYNQSATYSVTISVSNPGTSGQNDMGLLTDAGNTFENASVPQVMNGTGDLVAGTDTDDFYRIALAQGDSLTVSLTPPAGSDFDLKIFDPNGVQAGSSSQGGAAVDSIALTAPIAGAWRIRVYRYSGGGAYSLIISIGGLPPLPDLTSSAVVATSYSSGLSGASVPVTVLRAGGALTAGAYVTAGLYWSNDPLWDAGDIQLWVSNGSTPDYPNSSLNSSGSKTVTATVNIPPVAAGTYYLIVVADSSGFHAESNEGNNSIVYPVTVTVPTSLPDLTATATVAGSYTSGQSAVSIPLTVTRTGGALTAGAYVTAALFWSADAVWDAGDLQIWVSNGSTPDYPNSSLNSSGSKTVTATVDIPPVGNGSYYIIAVADSPGFHAESNEGNNVTPMGTTVGGSTTYSISPPSASVSENAGTVTFTVNRSGSFPAETVYVSTTTTEGFANNSDYTGKLNELLTFASGETFKTVTVSITNDAVVEPDETFGLIVQRNSTDPVTTYLVKATFTILNDDAAPTTYSISPPSASVSENAGTVTFTVNRSGSFPAETLYVSTTTTEGFANSGDYTGKVNELLTFASGETFKAVTVSITNDAVVEPDETFGLIVQRNSTDPLTTYLVKATFTILNDDAPPPTTYSISPPSSSVSESAGTVSFTVNRSGTLPAETLYVSTTQTEGFTNSGDYVGKLNELLTFASGETFKTITTSITNDSVVELDETFGLIVQRNSTDPLTTYLVKATFTILNDDAPPPTTYSISPPSSSVSESAGTVSFTVNRSGTLPAETLYVSTTQTEGFTNSGDYVGKLNELLTFASGETFKTITVSITNDSVIEPNETFGLVVQRNSTDPLTTYLVKATFTILNDD